MKDLQDTFMAIDGVAKRMEDGFEMSYVQEKDSASGKQLKEIRKLQQEFDKYVADQTAQNAAAEKRRELAEKRQFWHGTAAGAVCAAVVGIFLCCWPAIETWLRSLFR